MLRHGDREHVMKSEGFCKDIWAMRFESLLRRNSDVSKHEREINVVEIDAWGIEYTNLPSNTRISDKTH